MVQTESSIFIRNLRLYAFHGVMEQERRAGGWFIVSLRVYYNMVRASETDRVEDTLSYADLSDLVKREMAIPSQLLEHVAGRIIRRVQESFPDVTGIDLEVIKENPPMGANCQGAGISISVREEMEKRKMK